MPIIKYAAVASLGQRKVLGHYSIKDDKDEIHRRGKSLVSDINGDGQTGVRQQFFRKSDTFYTLCDDHGIIYLCTPIKSTSHLTAHAFLDQLAYHVKENEHLPDLAKNKKSFLNNRKISVLVINFVNDFENRFDSKLRKTRPSVRASNSAGTFLDRLQQDVHERDDKLKTAVHATEQLQSNATQFKNLATQLSEKYKYGSIGRKSKVLIDDVEEATDLKPSTSDNGGTSGPLAENKQNVKVEAKNNDTSVNTTPLNPEVDVAGERGKKKRNRFFTFAGAIFTTIAVFVCVVIGCIFLL